MKKKAQMPKVNIQRNLYQVKNLLKKKKPQKEQPKSLAQPKTATDTGYASLLSKKIDDFVHEIEGKPLKSFEKKDQQKYSSLMKINI